MKTWAVQPNSKSEVSITVGNDKLCVALKRVTSATGREFLSVVYLPVSCAEAILDKGVAVHSIKSVLEIKRVDDDIVVDVVINGIKTRKPMRFPVSEIRQTLGLP